ncbi:MAG: ABC transporter permease [Bacteroidota bacterium]
MIKNYIKVAFRSLINQKFYAILNISGLSVGLCCFLLITLYVTDELSYDRWVPNAENIYRMDFSGELGGNRFVTSLSSAPAAAVLIDDYPEVLEATRFRGSGERLLNKKGDLNYFKIKRTVWADGNLFAFFGIPIVHGDPAKVNSEPNQIALSASKAQSIFGDTNPVGQTVMINEETAYSVSAVFEDLPDNSHFHYDMIMSMETLDESKRPDWFSINFNTYLRLADGTNPAELEAKFPELAVKYIGPELEQVLGVGLDRLMGPDPVAAFSLMSLLDIHLYSDKLGELSANGDIQYVYIFSAIALFILLLACINFMNLATARSARRSKEVGVRKVMGAYKKHLIRQFLTEAMVISAISTLIAIVLTAFLLPFFNELAAKSISEQRLVTPSMLGIIGVIILLVGLLAGSYPSFYLSQFKPIETLKGKLNLGLRSSGIRSLLVVFQFTISISMIIGTAVVFDQLSYIQNKKLGFDKEHIVMIKDAWMLKDKAEPFRKAVISDSRVINGTLASFLPVKTQNNNNLFFHGNDPSNSPNYIIGNYQVDYNYIETLGMEIVQGRNFSRDFPTDTAAVLINEATAKLMNLENPIGTKIYSMTSNTQNSGLRPHKIIGVVKDFHFASLRDNIDPLLFQLGEDDGFVSFKIKGERVQETIAMIRAKWNEFGPGQPFDFDFLDQRFNALYSSEQQIGNIFSVFAFLAIFIACLGLYGLAAFTTEQKTKEIGIRKVLGASVTSIIALLSKEFIKLVGIAFIIAAAFTTFFMNRWLEDFVYRTNLKPLTFIIAGFLAIIIAFLTMGLQSYKAANSNPASTLKSE